MRLGTETPTLPAEEPLYEEPIVPKSRLVEVQQGENPYASIQQGENPYPSNSSTFSQTESYYSLPSTGRDSCLTGHSLSPEPSRFQSFTPSSGGSTSARSSVTSSALSRTSYQFGFWKVRFLRPPSVFTVSKETQSEAQVPAEHRDG